MAASTCSLSSSDAKQKILVLLSSAHQNPDGTPTGTDLVELAYLHNLLSVRQHYSLTYASADGGDVTLDPHSIESSTANDELVKEFLGRYVEECTKGTKSLKDIIEGIEQGTKKGWFGRTQKDKYDVLIIPGGRGAMLDLPYRSTDLQKLLSHVLRVEERSTKTLSENNSVEMMSWGSWLGITSPTSSFSDVDYGGFVATIGHGIAALFNVHDPLDAKKWFLEGKRVACPRELTKRLQTIGAKRISLEKGQEEEEEDAKEQQSVLGVEDRLLTAQDRRSVLSWVERIIQNVAHLSESTARLDGEEGDGEDQQQSSVYIYP